MHSIESLTPQPDTEAASEGCTELTRAIMHLNDVRVTEAKGSDDYCDAVTSVVEGAYPFVLKRAAVAVPYESIVCPEEVAADSLMNVVQKSGHFEGGSAEAWITTIVRNNAIDHGIKFKNRNHVLVDPTDSASSSLLEPSASLDSFNYEKTGADLDFRVSAEVELQGQSGIYAGEGRDGPYWRLETLSYAGFDEAEIAGILDLPEGTVKSRLSRGRARQREKVAEEGTSPEDFIDEFIRFLDEADEHYGLRGAFLSLSTEEKATAIVQSERAMGILHSLGAPITDAQAENARMIAQGISDEEIAKKRGIVHVPNIQERQSTCIENIAGILEGNSSSRQAVDRVLANKEYLSLAKQTGLLLREDVAVMELHQAGYSADGIAVELGVTVETIYDRFTNVRRRIASNLLIKPSPELRTNSMLEARQNVDRVADLGLLSSAEIGQLYLGSSGATDEEIAEARSVSLAAVRKMRRKVVANIGPLLTEQPDVDFIAGAVVRSPSKFGKLLDYEEVNGEGIVTEQQREIIGMHHEGHLGVEIARELGIGSTAVSAHIRRASDKIAVHVREGRLTDVDILSVCLCRACLQSGPAHIWQKSDYQIPGLNKLLKSLMMPTEEILVQKLSPEELRELVDVRPLSNRGQ